MTIAVNLNPDLEQRLRAKAEAKGISLEDYLPSLVAEAIQQEDWKDETTPIPAWDSAMRRIWDTPEEDAAWKHLEDP